MSDAKDDRIFVSKWGPIAIDWPHTIGFFGGLAAAVALDMITPPLGLAIAAVPLLKLLRRKDANLVERTLGAVLEGAAKPVGGDAEGCLRTREEQEEKERAERRQEHRRGEVGSGRWFVRRTPGGGPRTAARSPADAGANRNGAVIARGRP